MGLKDELVVSSDPNEEPDTPSDSELEVPNVDTTEQTESLDDSQSTEETSSTVIEEEEEEDLVDPVDEIRSNCQDSSHCAQYKAELDRCTERVESKENTTETCAQELYDFIHCVDHCVSKSLFKHLK